MMIRLLFAVSLLLLPFAVGCGGPAPATMSGSVTFNGQPVANGNIIMQAMDESGGVAKAKILDGKYMMGQEVGLTAGNYRVQIHGYRKGEAVEPSPEEGVQPEEGSEVGTGPDVGLDPNLVPYIPAKYNDNTELTIEVLPGTNDNKNFDLKP